MELNTDPGKARAFYTALFDWKLQDMPMSEGTYTTIDVGGGGMMQQMIPGAGSDWMPYVLVDDIAASTEKARSLGATIMKGVTEVPDMGWLSIITDPSGAVLGFWNPKE